MATVERWQEITKIVLTTEGKVNIDYKKKKKTYLKTIHENTAVHKCVHEHTDINNSQSDTTRN